MELRDKPVSGSGTVHRGRASRARGDYGRATTRGSGNDGSGRSARAFVAPSGEKPLTDDADFTGEPTDYRTLVRETKHQVIREILGSDVNRLTALFLEVCERHRRHRDYTRHELHEALRE